MAEAETQVISDSVAAEPPAKEPEAPKEPKEQVTVEAKAAAEAEGAKPAAAEQTVATPEATDEAKEAEVDKQVVDEHPMTEVAAAPAVVPGKERVRNWVKKTRKSLSFGWKRDKEPASPTAEPAKAEAAASDPEKPKEEGEGEQQKKVPAEEEAEKVEEPAKEEEAHKEAIVETASPKKKWPAFLSFRRKSREAVEAPKVETTAAATTSAAAPETEGSKEETGVEGAEKKEKSAKDECKVEAGAPKRRWFTRRRRSQDNVQVDVSKAETPVTMPEKQESPEDKPKEGGDEGTAEQEVKLEAVPETDAPQKATPEADAAKEVTPETDAQKVTTPETDAPKEEAKVKAETPKKRGWSPRNWFRKSTENVQVNLPEEASAKDAATTDVPAIDSSTANKAPENEIPAKDTPVVTPESNQEESKKAAVEKEAEKKETAPEPTANAVGGETTTDAEPSIDAAAPAVQAAA